MSYEVWGKVSQKVTIEKHTIKAIIDQEIVKILGGTDRYIDIEGNIIHGYFWHHGFMDDMGKATPEQVTLYNALRVCSKHFEK